MTAGDETLASPPQSDVGEPQRLLAIIGGEDAARRHDPRLAPGRQRVEIGVDDGMLNLGKRGVGSFS